VTSPFVRTPEEKQAAWNRSRERRRIQRKREEFKRLKAELLIGRTSGFVYFVTDGSGFVKIGCTSNSIRSRVAAMQTSNPRKLHLIATIETDNIAETEALLHEEFDEYRHEIGEWFAISIDQIVESLAKHGGSLV
jgi:hypothetical protein